MKFDMQSDSLVNYGKTGESTNEDLGQMIKSLIEAAEPLAKDFNGPAKAAFNRFHENSETVAQNLKAAHSAILGSASEQNRAFTSFQQNATDEISQDASAQNYDAAMWRRG